PYYLSYSYLDIAWNGHLSTQVPHLIQISGSILCTTLGSPIIAPTGQFFLHIPHALHLSESIVILANALHSPDGHFLSLTCAIYSFLKYFKVLNTGFGAVCPKPQTEAFLILNANFSNLYKSASSPFPSVILSNISNILLVPILQGVHLPQDSSTVNPK